ncbi:Nuclease [termite gut metagenome]|uniref:Nuclease n=1 Tax=termite gut metagenome TaxID=433724 RepID=A0A5J4RZ32_9ZZZZ
MVQTKKKRPVRKKREKKKEKSLRLVLKYFIFLFLLGTVLFFAYQCFCVRQQPEQKNVGIAAYPKLEIPQPLPNRREQIIFHTGYTVSYNGLWRLPNWVAYELTRSETRGAEKRSNRFVVDPQIKGASAANKDYLHSGYDKGHLAPAADMKWSRVAMKESFYFTNICPQHPQLNRHRWKELEDKVRDWANVDSAIVIVCGPLVAEKGTKTVGDNRVVVPQGFFKVILSPYVSPPQAIGFIFKNEPDLKPLQTFVVTVDSVEAITAMDFFSQLPDEMETTVESQVDAAYWGLLP